MGQLFGRKLNEVDANEEDEVENGEVLKNKLQDLARRVKKEGTTGVWE